MSTNPLKTPDPLAELAYASSDHRRLHETVHRWGWDTGVYAPEVERPAAWVSSHAAASYTYFCAPVTIWDALTPSAELTLFFFCLDDAWLLRPSVGTSTGASFDAAGQHCTVSTWFDQVQRDPAYDGRLKERFRTDFQRYCEGLREEAHIQRETCTYSVHWRIRQKTVFVDPFVSHWQVLCGIFDHPLTEQRATRTRRLVREVIILANDIGSFVRDESTGQDLNLAVLRAREERTDVQTAIAWLIERHNDKVRELSALLSDLGDSEPACRYRQLIRAVGDGNRRVMFFLTDRYPDPLGLLAQLEEL